MTVISERVRASLEPTFARHETFAPRYGWFKKTADAVLGDAKVFSAEDATLRLGVGKNMVRAMRFWAGAAGIVHPRKLQRNESLSLTPLGTVLLEDDGWDPYLELPASLWLLHWKLLEPGCQLPVWWFAFNDFPDHEFSVAGMTKLASDAVSVLYGLKEPAISSIRRDVECLVHTYARRSDARMAQEDALACPFRMLGLLDEEPGRAGTYRFRLGPKPSLPNEIVAFAAVDFAVRASAGSSISLGRLLREGGSPGKVFRLDEDSLLTALSDVARERDDIQLTDTAGVSALQLLGDGQAIALDLLNRYFRQVSGSKRYLHSLRDKDNDLVSLGEAPKPSSRGRMRRGSH